MTAAFTAALDFVLAAEGGYTADPHDPGGPTNCGITQRAWDAFESPAGHVAPKPVRLLTNEDVRAFYHALYAACRADVLPAPIDLCVFDTAVNCGQRFALVTLQRAVGGLVCDGVCGPATLAAVASAPPHAVVALMIALRRTRYSQLAESGLGRYWSGWMHRCDALEAACAALEVDTPTGAASVARV